MRPPTRRSSLSGLLAGALFVTLLPITAAAQTAETPEPAPPADATAQAPAPETPDTDAPAQWQVDDRVDRPEQGTMSGTVVLIDRQNLILETADGDRAFSLIPDTELPQAFRGTDDWAALEGFPVEVVFRPGDEGELRVVESLSVLPVESQENGEPQVDSVVAGGPVTPGEAATGTAAFAANTRGPAAASASADELAEGGATPDASAEARGAEAQGSEATAADRTADRDLPDTAGTLPWLVLMGLLAVGGALSLGMYQRLRPARAARPGPRARQPQR